MSDNLKLLTENVDTAIPINGGASSVKTANHNPLEKDIIKKVGKYTGLPFLASRSPIDGEVPVGSMFWNGNVMNKTDAFDIILSRKTLDGNDVKRILDLFEQGTFIHFKDFTGISVTLEFIEYIEDNTVEGKEFLILTVKGFAENSDYNYQVSDFELCMIEFINGNKQALEDLRNDIGGGGSLDDAVTKYGSVSIVDGKAVIEADDFNWRLNEVEFNDTPSFESAVIASASEGNFRSDIIVGTNTNGYIYVTGEESETEAPEPPIPTGTIRLAVIPIFGEIIGMPSTIPQGLINQVDYLSNFKVDKGQFYWKQIDLTGVVTDLDISDTLSTSINFINAITELESIYFPPFTIFPYSGCLFYIKNSQATPFLIKHEIGDIDTENRYIFSFSDEEDLELLPNQIVCFKLLHVGGTSRGKLEHVGIIPEDRRNKSQDIEEDKESDVKFGSVLAWITWLMTYLFSNITAKASELVDGDFFIIGDSEDDFKTKKRSYLQLLTQLKTYIENNYVGQITITTGTNITTDTLSSGISQHGKHVIIDNGASNITITVNGVGVKPTTYQKEGTGTITFVAGSGRTLRGVDGSNIMNGVAGSTCALSSFGTIDNLRISNAV